ncbi:MAG: carboxypeptidase regulatory-like domain-containing protein, partial [Bryobacterales bacterium]|nr:carboxypeptidase regulatory-like domain-containing protein [Bryobacterales bacterium]
MLKRLFLLALFCSASLLAQNAGVQGVVTDSSKAAVPGATVSISNVDTGVSSTASTTQDGRYTFPSLNPGRYRMECSSAGFATQQVSEFRLEVAQVARFDFELNPGSLTETIQVSAAAVLINTETTEVGQVIDGKRILEMPLNGRNYLQLAQFTAGALPGGGGGTGARSRGEGQFAAVGMQMAQNNVLLDGNDNSSRTSGGPLGFEAQQVKPPVDAVGEFKVITNNMSAEYGYRAGSKVLVTTRSGTNQLHGSAYEFFRNDKLDGANFFANRSGSAKPVYKQNQFGASLGGPVFFPKFYDGRNRTFFFGSFQGTRIREGQSYIQSVPSRDIIERRDFSNQPAVRNRIFDPLTTTGTGAAAVRTQFVNNIIPIGRVDPVVMGVIALYPASNIQGLDNAPNNYFYSPSNSNDENQYDFRGDHNINDNHRFFLRYSLRDNFRNQPGTLPFPAVGGQGQTVDLMGHNLAGALTSSITPTILNEFRVGWSRFNTAFDVPETENRNTALGILNAPIETYNPGAMRGMSRFSPGGFAEVGTRSFWPNVNNLHNTMFNNSTSVLAGRHSIKFGGEYRRQTIFRDATRLGRGNFTFDTRFTAQNPNNGTSRGNTGNGMATMMLGWVSGGSYGNNQGEEVYVPYWGFFIQDDIKITNRLTMNVGMR